MANRGDLIRELRTRGLSVAAAVPTRDYLPEVEQLGIDVHPFSMGRTGVSPLQDVHTTVSLVRLMRRARPRAVFGYTVKPVVYGGIAARLARVPRMYSMITGLGHAYTTENRRTQILRALISRLYRVGIGCADHVFFQNPDDLQEFVDRGIVRDPSKAVRINGSGVDTDAFARAPLPGGDAVFLFIGRLLTEKGIAEFVAAAREVRARWPQARFIAVGPHDPSLPHALPEEQLAEWRAEGVVEFVGGVRDVRPWLAACSVFVLPSYREGTPRSVLEAMSVGRAIVTSDAPGCRETVEDGVNGFLVPPREVVPLSTAMRRFLENPELVEQMAAESRRIVEGKYDVRKVNEVILKTMGFV